MCVCVRSVCTAGKEHRHFAQSQRAPGTLAPTVVDVGVPIYMGADLGAEAELRHGVSWLCDVGAKHDEDHAHFKTLVMAAVTFLLNATSSVPVGKELCVVPYPDSNKGYRVAPVLEEAIKDGRLKDRCVVRYWLIREQECQRRTTTKTAKQRADCDQSDKDTLRCVVGDQGAAGFVLIVDDSVLTGASMRRGIRLLKMAAPTMKIVAATFIVNVQTLRRVSDPAVIEQMTEVALECDKETIEKATKLASMYAPKRIEDQKIITKLRDILKTDNTGAKVTHYSQAVIQRHSALVDSLLPALSREFAEQVVHMINHPDVPRKFTSTAGAGAKRRHPRQGRGVNRKPSAPPWAGARWQRPRVHTPEHLPWLPVSS